MRCPRPLLRTTLRPGTIPRLYPHPPASFSSTLTCGVRSRPSRRPRRSVASPSLRLSLPQRLYRADRWFGLAWVRSGKVSTSLFYHRPFLHRILSRRSRSGSQPLCHHRQLQQHPHLYFHHLFHHQRSERSRCRNRFRCRCRRRQKGHLLHLLWLFFRSVRRRRYRRSCRRTGCQGRSGWVLEVCRL